jgi:hypothetical protein
VIADHQRDGRNLADLLLKDDRILGCPGTSRRDEPEPTKLVAERIAAGKNLVGFARRSRGKRSQDESRACNG